MRCRKSVEGCEKSNKNFLPFNQCFFKRHRIHALKNFNCLLDYYFQFSTVFAFEFLSLSTIFPSSSKPEANLCPPPFKNLATTLTSVFL